MTRTVALPARDIAPRSVSRSALPPLLGWLVAAGLADWLITRTLTRLAIFLPKSDAMIIAYQALAWGGQFATTLAALLALVGMAWMARQAWRTSQLRWLAASLAGLLALSLLFLVVPPGNWLLLYQGLALVVLVGIMVRGRGLPGNRRMALWLAAAAMLAATVHQAAPTLYTALGWAGPPLWGRPAFLVGEGLVLAAAGALWWAYGRGATRRAWLLAALPVALFTASYLATPSMTATIVIWSNGLTLFVPWWTVAGALWLFGVAVLRRVEAGDRPTAAALLLLAAAGYAPQLSSQFFLGLLALWLLSAPDAPR